MKRKKVAIVSFLLGLTISLLLSFVIPTNVEDVDAIGFGQVCTIYEKKNYGWPLETRLVIEQKTVDDCVESFPGGFPPSGYTETINIFYNAAYFSLTFLLVGILLSKFVIKAS